jgi:beta-catenin-like protein 1
VGFVIHFIIHSPFLYFCLDISIAVVDLLQEMTDVDTLTESEEGANVLIDALVGVQVLSPEWSLALPYCDFQLQGQVTALLIQNMERLDETVREEADGVHNSLGD